LREKQRGDGGIRGGENVLVKIVENPRGIGLLQGNRRGSKN